MNGVKWVFGENKFLELQVLYLRFNFVIQDYVILFKIFNFYNMNKDCYKFFLLLSVILRYNFKIFITF